MDGFVLENETMETQLDGDMPLAADMNEGAGYFQNRAMLMNDFFQMSKKRDAESEKTFTNEVTLEETPEDTKEEPKEEKSVSEMVAAKNRNKADELEEETYSADAVVTFDIPYARYLKETDGLFGRNMNADRKKEIEFKEAEEKYRKLMDSQEVVEMKFPNVTEKGDLRSFDRGWHIVMPNSDFAYSVQDAVRNRISYIMLHYSVTVSSIEEESRTIYVSHKLVKREDASKLRKYLSEMEEGTVCRIPAKVITAHSNMLILDLGGLGVPGYLRVAEYSKTYTIDMRSSVKRGDVMEVAVLGTGKLTRTELKNYSLTDGIEHPYECSRRRIMTFDPWEHVEERVASNDILIVKCEVKQEERFFGSSSLLPELNVYGLYPEKNGGLKRQDILVGEYYECNVKKVDEKERILRVRPFKWLKGYRES